MIEFYLFKQKKGCENQAEEKGEHQAQSQILQRSFLHLKYPCLVSEEADKGLVWYLTYKHMCVFVSTPGHSRLWKQPLQNNTGMTFQSHSQPDSSAEK